ncbi:fluoride efflux transporter CrcB [Hirschia baltica]|uniref:Fluoride-specific ion channel FluC n=1 Tax=Hirschia baltica (strain ATCC 49814 / DSM 5838 / IFAM 1418) TaxID=582402 RepID=C6XLD7_HIRBI|nr:fluoride efflux transporter CrcB [Hirschia baltica]ACT59736.1 CrcB protein [Hirschia baltica ATCC 49814]
MQNIVLVALGGAIGATARYSLSGFMLRVFGPGMPWGTFSANILGSLLLGVLTGWLAFKIDGGNNWRLFLATGVMGGFTTFSTFSLETMLMIERKAYLQAASYALGTLALGVIAMFIGLMIARKVFAI